MKLWFVYLPDTSGQLFVAGTVEAACETSPNGRFPGAEEKARLMFGATAFVTCAGPVMKPRVGNPRPN